MDRSRRTPAAGTTRKISCGSCATALLTLAIAIAATPGDSWTVPTMHYVSRPLPLTSIARASLYEAGSIAGLPRRSGDGAAKENLFAGGGSRSATGLATTAWRAKGPAMRKSAEECLSLNVYWEARNQSFAGQLAVAQVTMNRVNDSRYPDDVCEVVFDHKQFSWYWDGKSDVPTELRAWETAKLVASAAANGAGHAALHGVTHYHAVYVSPYWNDYLTLVTTIGDHIFYSGFSD